MVIGFPKKFVALLMAIVDVIHPLSLTTNAGGTRHKSIPARKAVIRAGTMNRGRRKVTPMTDAFTQSRSGLMVPAPKPEPPKYNRPPLEIQDDDQREKAKEALSLLWDAMALSSSTGGIVLPGDMKPEVRAAYWQAYHLIGKILLGDECPEKEVNT